MGAFNFAGMSSAQTSIILASGELSLFGGIIFGIVIFLILIVIAGFLILEYRRNNYVKEEDRSIGLNKGIAKNKLDN